MVPSPMYVPEGVTGILVQPAWGSFPWNRATCKRTQDWMLYANQVAKRSNERVTLTGPNADLEEDDDWH